MSPGEVTLEGLLEMSEEQVCELLQKFGANEEECARLNASLSSLRKAHQLGEGTAETLKDVVTGKNTQLALTPAAPKCLHGKIQMPHESKILLSLEKKMKSSTQAVCFFPIRLLNSFQRVSND